MNTQTLWQCQGKPPQKVIKSPKEESQKIKKIHLKTAREETRGKKGFHKIQKTI